MQPAAYAITVIELPERQATANRPPCIFCLSHVSATSYFCARTASELKQKQQQARCRAPAALGKFTAIAAVRQPLHILASLVGRLVVLRAHCCRACSHPQPVVLVQRIRLIGCPQRLEELHGLQDNKNRHVEVQRSVTVGLGATRNSTLLLVWLPAAPGRPPQPAGIQKQICRKCRGQ